MGRFDFQSPGAAFVDTMAKVLAERKAEQRQEMLDRLTRAAEARAERESQAMDEHREWQRSQAEEAAAMNRWNVIGQNLTRGQEPTGMSPEDLELGKRLGYLSPDVPGATPQVSDSYSISHPELESGEAVPEGSFSGAEGLQPQPAQTPKLRAVGSKEEREQERVAKRQGSIIGALLQSEKPEEREKGQLLLQLTELNDGKVPEQAWDMLMPDVPLHMFDEASGKVTKLGTVPRTGQVVTRNRPPRVPASDYMPREVGITPEGHTIYLWPNGKETVGANVQASLSNTDTSALGIPVGTSNAHRENLVRITPKLLSGWNLRSWLPGDQYEDEVNPDDLLLFKKSAIDVIEAAKLASPRVRQLARAYVNNPQDMADKLQEVDLTDSELNQLSRLIDTVVPKELSHVLVPKEDDK